MAEPIAVIGLDAKYPCDGNTPEQFYEFLVAGRSARGPVPPDRYNANSFWHPDSHRDGIVSFSSTLSKCNRLSKKSDWWQTGAFYSRKRQSL